MTKKEEIRAKINDLLIFNSADTHLQPVEGKKNDFEEMSKQDVMDINYSLMAELADLLGFTDLYGAKDQHVSHKPYFENKEKDKEHA